MSASTKKKVYTEKSYKVPDNFYYWEVIAAWIWNTRPDKLFEKTRLRDVVEARFASILYMHEILGLTQAISTGRYYQNHAQAVHAKKRISDWYEVDKKFKERYDTFLKTCRSHKKIKPALMRKNGENLDEFLLSVSGDFNHLLHLVSNYKNDIIPEDEIRILILKCRYGLMEIDKIFL